MKFTEKYKNRLFVGWWCILVSMPLLALAIIVWQKEAEEMLNEIKVADEDIQS